MIRTITSKLLIKKDVQRPNLTTKNIQKIMIQNQTKQMIEEQRTKKYNSKKDKKY